MGPNNLGLVTTIFSRMSAALAGLASNAGPIMLQSAPASVLGIEVLGTVYTKLNTTLGAEYTTSFVIAIAVGLISSVGIEFVGGSLSHATVNAYWRGYRDMRLYLPLIGVVIYVSIVISTIAILGEENGKMLGFFSLLTPFAWFGFSYYRHVMDETEQQGAIDARAHEIALANIALRSQESKDGASIVRAQARIAKETGQPVLPASMSEEIDMSPVSQRQRLPVWMDKVPANKAKFIQYVQEGSIRLPSGVTSGQIEPYVPVSDRSCRDWLSTAREMGLL